MSHPFSIGRTYMKNKNSIDWEDFTKEYIEWIQEIEKEEVK